MKLPRGGVDNNVDMEKEESAMNMQERKARLLDELDTPGLTTSEIEKIEKKLSILNAQDE